MEFSARKEGRHNWIGGSILDIFRGLGDYNWITVEIGWRQNVLPSKIISSGIYLFIYIYIYIRDWGYVAARDNWSVFVQYLFNWYFSWNWGYVVFAFAIFYLHCCNYASICLIDIFPEIEATLLRDNWSIFAACSFSLNLYNVSPILFSFDWFASVPFEVMFVRFLIFLKCINLCNMYTIFHFVIDIIDCS